MGLLKSLAGIAAPIAGSFFGPVGTAIGGALGGALSSSGQPKSQTTTQQQQLDPRIANIVFGQNGSGGLLSQYQTLGQTPQNDRLKEYANANLNYLMNQGPANQAQQQESAMQLLNSSIQAPQSQAAQLGPVTQAQAAQVNAPSQNNLNLTGSYNSLINGQAGNNPYLTGAIQKGINQSNNAFGNYLTDAKSATQDLLGGIRGGAIASGQYGSSRQGIAEGKALDSFNTNIGRAASQFGQNNTDAAVAAQSGQYNADRDRQLAATQGLSGQQYGVASQNANLQQQANLQNAGAANAAALANAGFQQQSGLANQNAQLGTNQLNTQRQGMGQGFLSGLTNNAYNVGMNQDNYAINRAGQVNNLLTPYLSANSSQQSTTPLYNNAGASALGGAAAGLGLMNMLGGSNNRSAGSNPGSIMDLFGSNGGLSFWS
jgi:hypothetical protein